MEAIAKLPRYRAEEEGAMIQLKSGFTGKVV